MGSMIVQFLLTYFPVYGYFVLFFSMLVVGSYIPVPGGIVLIAVGAFARDGHFNIVLAFFAALAGSVASDAITFYIVRRVGRNNAYKKYVENHKFAQKIEEYAKKYPKSSIIISRFIGFTTAPVDAIMGLSQIRMSTFVSMDAIGNAICTFIYLAVGYLIGIRASQTTHVTTLISISFGVIVALYFLGFILVQVLKD
jgi:membrane protein DedA with SNARE-associated domain